MINTVHVGIGPLGITVSSNLDDAIRAKSPEVALDTTVIVRSVLKASPRP